MHLPAELYPQSQTEAVVKVQSQIIYFVPSGPSLKTSLLFPAFLPFFPVDLALLRPLQQRWPGAEERCGAYIMAGDVEFYFCPWDTKPSLSRFSYPLCSGISIS